MGLVFSGGGLLFANGSIAMSTACCCNIRYCYVAQVTVFATTELVSIEDAAAALLADLTWVPSQWRLNFAGFCYDGTPSVGETTIRMNFVTCSVVDMDQQEIDVVQAASAFCANLFGPQTLFGTCILNTLESQSPIAYHYLFDGTCESSRMSPMYVTTIYSPLECLCDASGQAIPNQA